MKCRNVLTRLITSALCISMLGTASFAAGTTDSDVMPRDTELMSREIEKVQGGITYTAYSSLYVGTQYRAGIWVVADEILEEGAVDARAILYDETGAVLAQTNWVANEAGLKFNYAITSKVTSSETVIANGEFKIYDADGAYTGKTWYIDSTDSTFKDFNTRAVNELAYEQTATGETYGSLILADQIGQTPDFISAVGIDGTRGYVRAEEFDPEFLTYAARKAYSESLKEDNMIPLYDLEGNVIGQYELGVPSDEPETDPLVLEKIQQLGADTSANRLMTEEKTVIESEESEVQEMSYPVTENGETYGCLPDAQKIGFLPDLIRAVGENGVHGYIRKADYNAKTASNEERTVPVYDLKGNAVDEFTFKSSKDLEGIRIPE